MVMASHCVGFTLPARERGRGFDQFPYFLITLHNKTRESFQHNVPTSPQLMGRKSLGSSKKSLFKKLAVLKS